MKRKKKERNDLKHYCKTIAEGFGCLHSSIQLTQNLMADGKSKEDSREIEKQGLELIRKQVYLLWQMVRDLGNTIGTEENKDKGDSDADRVHYSKD